ncbi:AraC family transcriptional regulator [Pedobacter sp. MC2016-14]|uniref:helix-turn-helix domain-containing protein n=1 Tax=Pedobacter sp. MC2016-14 TaxID=2897327 RepID=UPI001E36B39A|nr:AraC family transcriptional regulator [Pedobacter sp. MC2016-14]MCD0487481.1 AraC family transcriptional regulator [Pedobacter sp. MC2016-14]
MTQSGEQLTQSGEIQEEMENVFSLHKAMAISRSINIEDRNMVEVNLDYPADQSFANFQMIFVLKGKIKFIERGGSFNYGQIESQQHNLCCILPKSTRMILSEPDDEIICINLNRSFLQRYLPAAHPIWTPLDEKQLAKSSFMLSAKNLHLTPEISAILQRLGASANGGFCEQLILESKVIELLALQIAQFEQLQYNEVPSLLGREEMERMQQVREILLSHTGEQLSLKALAHLVGTNEFNLKRDFKIAFGNTVYGYLNQHKMERSRTMLIEENITISELATKMGYKYATHFTNAFKKYYGYLPNKIKSTKLSLLIFIEHFSALFENLELIFGL